VSLTARKVVAAHAADDIGMSENIGACNHDDFEKL
jgi:hypothetical protein